MTDAKKIDTADAQAVPHGNIAAALAAAQAEMGKAIKSATNPHFRNKYADLSSVMDACMPALTAHGIAVIQPTTDEDGSLFVETILIHNKTSERLKCRVPLIISKDDMQGYGSAVTYARRYGLMSMAGIAPEDDDGNAAAKAPPKQGRENEQRFKEAKAMAVKSIGNADNLEALKAIYTELPQGVRSDTDVVKAKDDRKAFLAAPAQNADLSGDEIPY